MKLFLSKLMTFADVFNSQIFSYQIFLVLVCDKTELCRFIAAYLYSISVKIQSKKVNISNGKQKFAIVTTKNHTPSIGVKQQKNDRKSFSNHCKPEQKGKG